MVCLGTEAPTNMNNVRASNNKWYVHKKEATKTAYCKMFGCRFVILSVVKTIYFLHVNDNMENVLCCVI
jgi:hypothetical protein